MLLMIDNYDSFTFNLVQYFRELKQDVLVKRNDKLSVTDIANLDPDYLVISPGPCTPDESGISLDAVKYFAGKIPILGVCLGHQVIFQAFGGKIIRAPKVKHGYTSEIFHAGDSVFRNLPSPFIATRYHSLIIDDRAIRDDFKVTAWTESENKSNILESKLIMGIQHRTMEIHGIQFHPESILTDYGHQLLENFLKPG